jgi:hypothetical protein
MQNAHSRYFAPAKPMALGTRTPNERNLTDVYAGLPRDLGTELTANTVAKLRAIFGLQATTETAPKHQNQERRSQAFNASNKRRPDRDVRWRPQAGTNLIALLMAVHHRGCA